MNIRELRQIMSKNRKNILKWICGGVAALLILLVAGGWWLFSTFITAANSIEKLEDGLYSMEYNGDYGFDDFLTRGGAANDCKSRALVPSSLTFVLISFPHIPALTMRRMSGICWNPWHRKTIRRQRAAMKRQCGALCIVRRPGVLISTLWRIMNTAMD